MVEPKIRVKLTNTDIPELLYCALSVNHELRHFVENPKQFSCNHFACEKCIQEQQQQDTDEIKCRVINCSQINTNDLTTNKQLTACFGFFNMFFDKMVEQTLEKVKNTFIDTKSIHLQT